jgi:uncharacterized protein YoxC
MDPILIIFLCVALAAVAIMCIAATVTLLNARRSLDRMVVTVERTATDMHEIKTRLTPVLIRSEELLEQMHHTLQQADKQIEKISKGADAFASIAEDVRSFESGIMNRIRPSVDELTGMFAGAVKGVTTFIKTLSSR